MSNIDRRTFVFGGAALGLTALAGSTLVGCAGKTEVPEEPTSETPADQAPTDQHENARDSESAAPSAEEPKKVSTVYMVADISPEGLIKTYKALGVQASGHVAVKVTTGEPGGHNFLQPDFMKDFVQLVQGTIVECNCAGGLRMNTADHYQVAADHGFTSIAEVDIMDAEGSIALPVNKGRHLVENQVGSHFQNYDFFVSLAHFKGHGMAGYGGALKNTSIGIASSQGKSLIHSGGTQTTGFSADTPQDVFQESMCEAAMSVVDRLGENIIYINVMNNLSVDCDCVSNPAAPEMVDIGILASTDPVALDQACIDLVYAASDGQPLIQRIESRNGVYTLEYAEAIGLGSRKYELINV